MRPHATCYWLLTGLDQSEHNSCVMGADLFTEHSTSHCWTDATLAHFAPTSDLMD